MMMFKYLLIMCLLATPVYGAADVGAILGQYPDLQAEPFGKGVYVHWLRITGKQKPGQNLTLQDLQDTPGVSGAQLSIAVDRLNPSPGNYDWDYLDSVLEPWASVGKKCWIEVAQSSSSNYWMYEDVPIIQAPGTLAYPLFWDELYISRWTGFWLAFAEKYDGDPRIEFISTGGYARSFEPNLVNRDNAATMSQWNSYGFDNFALDGPYLNEAIIPILDMFDDVFTYTEIATTVHVKSSFDDAMNRHAASLGFTFISNGMSTNVANRSGRTTWADRKANYGTKVGYAEWGPTGRQIKREPDDILSEDSDTGGSDCEVSPLDLNGDFYINEADYAILYENRRGYTPHLDLNGDGKVGRADGNVIKDAYSEETYCSDTEPEPPVDEWEIPDYQVGDQADIMWVYRGVIGDADSNHWSPFSGHSYVPCSGWLPDLETYEEWQAAMLWAREHLEDN
jgi:hypothetical protein